MKGTALFYERVAKALKKKRIPTAEERQRKAKRHGGFDDSYITKQTLKDLEKDKVCQWCHQPVYAIADGVHITGNIIMSCRSDGCWGNYHTKKSEKKRTNPKMYGRIIDKKLCYDLGELLIGRDPARLWATKRGLVL